MHLPGTRNSVWLGGGGDEEGTSKSSSGRVLLAKDIYFIRISFRKLFTVDGEREGERERDGDGRFVIVG